MPRILPFIIIIIAFFGWFVISNQKEIVEKVSSDTVQVAPDDSITLLFTGDMMFDRTVRKTLTLRGFDTVFGDSKKIFSGADMVIANLEGPVTTYPSSLYVNGVALSGFNFTFPTTTATALKEHGVDIVNLANNHTANKGKEGLRQTKEYLGAANVRYFGDPGNNINETSTTTCQDNFCIALIGWHEFAGTPGNEISIEIQRLRAENDIVVVLPHWGVEYKKEPTAGQISLARLWIDAGADMVIGTHPHVVAAIEEYKGKAIFYSLGNFIFDQYFSYDTTHGLVVSVKASKNASSTVSFEYRLIPMTNVGNVVSSSDATSTSRMLQDLVKISTAYVSTSTLLGISKGIFTLQTK